jgi:hypothetical protein
VLAHTAGGWPINPHREEERMDNDRIASRPRRRRVPEVHTEEWATLHRQVNLLVLAIDGLGEHARMPARTKGIGSSAIWCPDVSR